MCIRDSSCIVTRRKEFTFGSPHLLYGYYKEKGRLQHTAEYLAQHSESLTADGICGCNTWKKLTAASVGIGRTRTVID